MRLLVTGGTGFIGSRLALRCLGDGHHVVAMGRERSPVEAENRQRIENAGGEVVVGSVTDRALVYDVISGCDVVVHLAAVQHEMDVPDEVFREVNVEGTRIVAQGAAGEGVARFVHGSTIGVYGDPDGPVDESTPLAPDDIYGRTKAEGEAVVRDLVDDLPAVVIRIPEVYGPGDRRLLKLFRGVRNGTFPMLGAGDNLHHPVFVEDLLDGLLLAGDRPEAVGETLLLPGSEALTTRQMARKVADAVDTHPPRLRLPLGPFVVLATVLETVLRPMGVQPPLHTRRLDFFRKSFRVDSERASRVLGYRPETSFAEGARRTAEWYRREGLL